MFCAVGSSGVACVGEEVPPQADDGDGDAAAGQACGGRNPQAGRPRDERTLRQGRE